MRHLKYSDNVLLFEQVDLRGVAKDLSTPLYVYSEATLKDHFQHIDTAFRNHPHLICYALKANSNPAIIRNLAALGAGADVVSLGELRLALQAGISPEKIVFAGVGKRDDEILAALEVGIKGFNVESQMELEVIDHLAAETGKQAPISLRVNPNIDIHGHPYISTGRHHDKFGISWDAVSKLAKNFCRFPNCELIGLHAHLGSQISEIAPFARLGKKLRSLAKEVRSYGHALQYLDIGGGLGVDYEQPLASKPDGRGTDDLAIDPGAVAAALLESLGDLGLQLIFEPGRALVASAGLLLTRVLYLKETAGKRFIIVDAGMSELLRPSLYKAYHAIVPVVLQNSAMVVADVVGPICESGDFFARDRELPAVDRGDILAVLTAGAYGFSLSSNYNARPRPAEALVSGKGYQIIRERQRIESIWQ